VVVFPKADGSVCASRGDATDLRLDCNSGLGTASFITGSFGFAAAARIVRNIAVRE
jgi:tRNA A37 threonylcarbamoyladenosine dehydratase